MDKYETCDNMRPTCRGKTMKMVKRACLTNHIEASVFKNGLVSVGKLCSKIIERKGSIWVAKLVKITTKDT